MNIAAHCRAGARNNHGYAPRHPWPDNCTVQWGQGIVPRNAFFEAFPQAPSTFIRGDSDPEQHGTVEGIAAAEDAAWEKFQRYRACDKHEWTRKHKRIGWYRNGAGFCSKCGLFSSRKFPHLPENCDAGAVTSEHDVALRKVDALGHIAEMRILLRSLGQIAKLQEAVRPEDETANRTLNFLRNAFIEDLWGHARELYGEDTDSPGTLKWQETEAKIRAEVGEALSDAVMGLHTIIAISHVLYFADDHKLLPDDVVLTGKSLADNLGVPLMTSRSSLFDELDGTAKRDAVYERLDAIRTEFARLPIKEDTDEKEEEKAADGGDRKV